jgi:Putative Actinobacterial Holin-X, holin superfamily III
MGEWIDGWIRRFRELGDGLLAVLRAELATLQQDLARSGRHLGVALGLLGGALVILFWWVALLIALLVAVLALWLQLWAAILAVLLLFTAGAAVLAWLGWRRWRRVENPVETVRRHVDDHLDWWQNGLLRDRPLLDVEAAPPGGASEEDEEEDLP